MTQPILRQYIIEKQLSSNSLSVSWIAKRKSDGRTCFLKTLASSEELTWEARRSILARSWSLQQQIRTSSILVSRRKVRDQDQLVIEYPLLGSPRWHTLSHRVFLDFFPATLMQVLASVEYLHCLGLVHCDLKLENFRYCRTSTGIRLVLTDLDFLCASGDSPDAKIFGTPDHIAPEILAGSLVGTEADFYSLGISLQKVSRRHSGSDLESNPWIMEKLEKLGARLSSKDIHARAGCLTGAALSVGFIDESQHVSLLKKTLLLQLSGMLRPAGAHLTSKPDPIRRALRACGVLGVSDELASSMDNLFDHDFTKCLAVLKGLVVQCSLNRQGKYWLISLSDLALREIYDAVDSSLAGHSVSKTRFESNGSLRLVRLLETEGLYERAFLVLKKIHGTNPQSHHLLPLADLASRMSKPDAAIQYLITHLSCKKQVSFEDVPVIHKLVKELLTQSRLDEAETWVRRGIEILSERTIDHYSLKLEIQRAWLAGCRGEYDLACHLLLEAYDSACRHKIDDEEVSAAYCLGVIEWRRGDMKLSEKWLLRAHNRLIRYDTSSQAVPVNAMLALLYHETALYHRAVKHAKLAINVASEPRDKSSLPPVYLNLVASLARLGEFGKAQYWIQACANFLDGEVGAARRLSLLLTEGWLELAMCNLDKAGRTLERALRVDHSGTSNRNLGKVYQNLAEICLMQGDQGRLEHFLAKATELFQGSSDVNEVQLIRLLSQAVYRDELEWSDWTECYESLVSSRQYYPSAVCLLFMLLHADTEVLGSLIDLYRPLSSLTRRSRAPLFEAIETFIRASQGSGLDRPLSPTALKSVYRLLERGQHRFLGIAACSRVARIYNERGNTRLARKFLCQARSIAQDLTNEAIGDRIGKEILLVDRSTDQRESLMTSFEGISQVLHGIRDRTLALNRLVELAVEETGAERGVLLLKRGDAGRLKTEAQFACDEDSIEDIERISSSVPSTVLESLDSLIVDNAIQDERTRNLKSIVKHNVLSVVCAPVYRQGKVAGVLYLDHHTIPSLFDVSDLSFIRAITNFISISLVVVDDFRHLLVTNRELSEVRQRHGDSRIFVSQDPAIKEIFSQIPRIARSNASILLIGESGTGKEIIGQIIHDQSNRSDKPFVRFNCSAIASTMVEAELFGVAPRSATNVEGREGKLSAADNGTLFVDEIGDMPLNVQAKILRAVEYQHFEKVGSNRTLYTDIRFIYATNRDLGSMVANDQFRRDLLYRINTITIEIPPLRHRKGDIPLLLDHFSRLFNRAESPVTFAPQAQESLIAHAWPGNVRELMNLVQRFSIVYPGGVIESHMLPEEILKSHQDQTPPHASQEREAQALRRALDNCGWNQTKAAQQLGVPRTTLSRKMKNYGLRN